MPQFLVRLLKGIKVICPYLKQAKKENKNLTEFFTIMYHLK